MALDDKAPLPRRWAELRFSVIGPLLASPPERGQLGREIRRLSGKLWKRPDGQGEVSFGASSIERWYYQARDAADPVAALTRRVRKDAGKSRALTTGHKAALKTLYKEHPGWSAQLHADNLAALCEERPAELDEAPSASTVHRYMRVRGWVRKRKRRNPTPGQRAAAVRLETLEVRSFERSHVHALWHLDFHEAKRRVVDAAGIWHTPEAMCVLDDCSRLCCHMQWYLVEDTENLVHGLGQAIAKRGLPREQMHDNGGAMRAGETQNGLRDLGILSEPTLSYSPYQNGKQEHFWETAEGRLMAMLESVEPLTLSALNRATQAWVELEYNRRPHRELNGKSPIERALQGPSAVRDTPDAERLRLAFTLEQTRSQRKSDGTISVAGVRFELPSRFRTLGRVTVRYRRWDLSSAWVIDPRTKVVLARIRPLDKLANADGRRRTLAPLPDAPEVAQSERSGDPMPPLMRKLLADYAATGLPPAYLPKDELPYTTEEEDDDA